MVWALDLTFVDINLKSYLTTNHGHMDSEAANSKLVSLMYDVCNVFKVYPTIAVRP